jgi:hypothetical protein
MRQLIIAAALASTLGCATAKVTTEYNQKTDFAAYKSYSWIDTGAGQEQAPAIRNPAVVAIVRQSMDRELAAKGLAKVEGGQPDLLVAVHGMAKDRIEVQSYGYAYSPYGYYGGPFGAPVAYGSSVQQYRDGTLLVDLVDARSKELVWRGTASDTVSDPAQVQSVVANAIHRLMAEYPPSPAKK